MKVVFFSRYHSLIPIIRYPISNLSAAAINNYYWKLQAIGFSVAKMFLSAFPLPNSHFPILFYNYSFQRSILSSIVSVFVFVFRLYHSLHLVYFFIFVLCPSFHLVFSIWYTCRILLCIGSRNKIFLCYKLFKHIIHVSVNIISIDKFVWNDVDHFSKSNKLDTVPMLTIIIFT